MAEVACYRKKYDYNNASFTSIPAQPSALQYADPPDNCPVCHKGIEQQDSENPRLIKKGFAIGYQHYHWNDFIMIKADTGVCKIGQIIGVRFPEATRESTDVKVHVQLLGRVSDILYICPKPVFIDEVSGKSLSSNSDFLHTTRNNCLQAMHKRMFQFSM